MSNSILNTLLDAADDVENDGDNATAQFLRTIVEDGRRRYGNEVLDLGGSHWIIPCARAALAEANRVLEGASTTDVAALREVASWLLDDAEGSEPDIDSVTDALVARGLDADGEPGWWFSVGIFLSDALLRKASKFMPIVRQQFGPLLS